MRNAFVRTVLYTLNCASYDALNGRPLYHVSYSACYAQLLDALLNRAEPQNGRPPYCGQSYFYPGKINPSNQGILSRFGQAEFRSIGVLL